MDEEEDVLLSVDDYHRHAKSKMTKSAYGYYVGGSEDEHTLRLNQQSFQKILLMPKVMVDVDKMNTTTKILGQSLSSPILISPTAMHKLAHPDGEKATAAAAIRTGSIMILSQSSSSSVEEVAEAMKKEMIRLKMNDKHSSNGKLPLWFQLYITRDTHLNRLLVKRAEDAGCSALVVTVDFPVTGKRENNVRNKFTYPEGVEPVHFKTLFKRGEGDQFSDSSSHIASIYDSSLNWSYIPFLRSITNLPIIIKGILRPEDAVKAAELGVDAVVVSNHGGRQLDSAIPPILALSGIVNALKGSRCLVLVDGGFKRGRDILKAIAIGADGVGVGRAVLWGLAHSGADGAESVLNILKDEFQNSMALCGCTTIGEITKDLVTTEAKLLSML